MGSSRGPAGWHVQSRPTPPRGLVFSLFPPLSHLFLFTCLKALLSSGCGPPVLGLGEGSGPRDSVCVGLRLSLTQRWGDWFTCVYALALGVDQGPLVF